MSRTSVARRLLLALATALLALSSSCVHTNTRELSPSVDEARIQGLRSFHVRRHERDDHGLSKTIANQLRTMGYRATEGGPESGAGNADALLTYIDRWYWDITPYMLSLSVQARDPDSESVLATAQTTRSSLARKSPEAMANETLGKLLGKETP